MAKKQQSVGWLVVALVIAGVMWWMNNRPKVTEVTEQGGEETRTEKPVVKADVVKQPSSPAPSTKRQDPTPKTKPSSGGSKAANPGAKHFTADDFKLLTPVRHTTGNYTELKGCSLKEVYNNDGDSFHVRHPKGETEFRLYFVDTPESRLHRYNGERIDQQGQYFGGLNRDQTIKIGKAGKALTKKLLGHGKFTVLTKCEKVTKRDDEKRMHAFVLVNLNGEDYYLHELLTVKGLVRIHTWGGELPDGTKWRDQKDNLFSIEKKVRAAKRGGWSR